MVLGELFEPAVPLEIRARVTDVSDRDAAPVDDGDRHRRAHPGDVRVLGGALVDALVRRLDQRDDAFLAASAAAASPDATSPARGPPMPSATANSGGLTT